MKCAHKKLFFISKPIEIVCLQEVNTYHSVDQLNEFMLKHGENIVDIMGDEIDRIEMNLSVSE